MDYAKYLSKNTMKPFFSLPTFYALFNDSFDWPMSLIIKYEKKVPKVFFSFANIWHMIRKSIVKYQIHWTWLYKSSPFIPFFQHLAPLCGGAANRTIPQTCNHIFFRYYSANFNEFIYCMLNKGLRDKQI